MLRINYNKETNLTNLNVEKYSPAWVEICRVCQEKSMEVQITDNSLTMPWWSFLACKGAIRLIVRKHGLRLDIGPEATDLLQESNKKREAFKGIEDYPFYDIDELKELLRSVGFVRNLTSQQLRNVSKLLQVPAGATFSVPGAGKTTEALAYYYLKKKETTRLLVVAPKNAFSAWEEQLQLCVPKAPEIVRLRGGVKAVESLLEKKPQIMLISYQQLPNVLSELITHLSKQSIFIYLDESHRIKRGEGGVIGNAVLNISHIPDAKLILSGTPMPNSTVDLVPQFNFLYPEVRVDAETVIDKIRRVYVRTTKDELGLSTPKFITKLIPMSSAQRKLYELLRSEDVRQAEILRAQERNKLRAMGKSAMRMLQLTSNPRLLLKLDLPYKDIISDIISEGDSPKIKYVQKRVRYLAEQGKKTIVWSSFVENIELLSLRLSDLGADYIHGGVDAGDESEIDTREAKIKRFHDDPNACVLIANPAAAGEGISLHTVCHDAIYLDRNYNAAQFLQSVDRIHRLGLSKEIMTNIEIVFSPNTIDESVDRRLRYKINKMSEVLNDPSLNIQPEYDSVEIDGEGMNLSDIEDFLRHVKEL